MTFDNALMHALVYDTHTNQVKYSLKKKGSNQNVILQLIIKPSNFWNVNMNVSILEKEHTSRRSQIPTLELQG